MSVTKKKWPPQLVQLLTSLNISAWDILLIGDGSGSTKERPCGWSCISIEKEAPQRLRTWTGCMSTGTNNIAEMMAYLQPLSHYAAIKQQQEKSEVAFLSVHIITDSEYVKNSGIKRVIQPNMNGAFWQIFESFRRQGLSLRWHYIPRDTWHYNKLADSLSKQARLLIQEHEFNLENK